MVAGLVLLVAGGLALARGLGAFGAGFARAPLVPPAVSQYVAGQVWVWPLAAAICVAVALLGLRWLLVQGRSGRLRSLPLESDRSAGGTHMPADAVTDALEEEITGYPGVSRVHASLGGADSQPRLALSVACDDRADLGELRTRIHDQALAHVCSALELDRLPTVLRLRLASGKGQRVR